MIRERIRPLPPASGNKRSVALPTYLHTEALSLPGVGRRGRQIGGAVMGNQTEEKHMTAEELMDCSDALMDLLIPMPEAHRERLRCQIDMVIRATRALAFQRDTLEARDRRIRELEAELEKASTLPR